MTPQKNSFKADSLSANGWDAEAEVTDGEFQKFQKR